VDAAAVKYAKQRGLKTVEFFPYLKGLKKQYEMQGRYHKRNQKIVDQADEIVAFTEKKTGGTWDTIQRARKAGKPVKIFMEGKRP